MACTTSASGTVSSTDMLSHRPELRDLATRQPSAGLSGTMAGHTASWQTGRDQTCKDASGIHKLHCARRANFAGSALVTCTSG